MAMDTLSKEIESWLRSQMLIARPAGEIVRFEVRHLSLSAKKGSEVALVEVPRTVNDEWFESTGSEVAIGLQCEADALGGVQRYVLLSFREKEKDKAQSRKILRVAAEILDDDDDSGYDSEPKNIKGAFAQMMRHNEAYAKTMANMMAAAVNTQSRQISRQAEHIEKLLDQRMETLELVESLQSERQKRDLEMLKAENREKMLTEVMGEVKLLGPAIVNKMVGKDVLPVASDPAMLAMKRLGESLAQSPERMAKIADQLSPSEKVAFGTILQTLNQQN